MRQEFVRHQFPNQHSIRDEFDLRACTATFVKTDRISDRRAQRNSLFRGNTSRKRRSSNSSRLGDCNAFSA
jgi:hypothetical protein